MRVVICEDDALYQESIREKVNLWIQKTGHADTWITVFGSSEDLLERWRRNLKADILFLDIQFHHEMDGMELAQQIRTTDANVLIVFITNSEAYVYEGYTVSALRYLSKPVYYEDIALCLDIAYKHYALTVNDFFILAEPGRKLALSYAEILCFEAQSHYLHIFTAGAGEPVKMHCRLGDVLARVPRALFIPCHRSYIVNLAHVRGLKRSELLLSNGMILPVSKTYVNVLNSAFDSYYQGGETHALDGV